MAQPPLHTPTEQAQTELSSIASSVDFYGIRSDQIYKLWEVVEPMIGSALEYSDGKYDTDDIHELLEEKQMQLWVVVENKIIIACGVTQIVIYPQKKVCLLVVVAGKDFSRWSDKLNYIEEWACDIGCTSFEAYCRPGWEKILKDWEKIHTVMRKSIHENMH